MAGKSNFSVLGSFKDQLSKPVEADPLPERVVQFEATTLVAVPTYAPVAAPVTATATPPVVALPVAAGSRERVGATRKRRTNRGPVRLVNAEIPEELFRKVKIALAMEERSFADLLETTLNEYVAGKKI